MTSNPTPAPQPLTDEEVEEWEKDIAEFVRDHDDCDLTYGLRAIARIRADGRRIERLKKAVQDKTTRRLEGRTKF